MPAFASLAFVASLRSYATITPGASATTLLPSSHCDRSAQASPSGRCPPCSDLPLAGEAPTSPEQDDPSAALRPDHPAT